MHVCISLKLFFLFINIKYENFEQNLSSNFVQPMGGGYNKLGHLKLVREFKLLNMSFKTHKIKLSYVTFCEPTRGKISFKQDFQI